MRIIVVGAGEVGWYLAEVLEAEHHQVVVVEADPARADELAASLDVQVVAGSGSSPRVLAEAGIGRADVMACVTNVDEVNLIAALMGCEHGVSNTVVRLQSAELRGEAGAKLVQTVGADLVIDPDAETADEILALIHSPGAAEVYEMPVGDLVVIGAVLGPESEFGHRSLSQIAQRFGSEADFLFGAVASDNGTVIPHGDQTLEPGDHVRILTTSESSKRMKQLLGIQETEARRVMVLGGGAIGSQVAEKLQAEGTDVVIVERDPRRARALAESLHKVVVVEGQITDTDLLATESIGRMDAVVAATGEDAANVLACGFAASEGTGLTVAVLHKLELLPLISKFGIDAALSPRTASANAVLRQVRGRTAAVATFLESDVEVDEFLIEPGCKAEGKKVSDLKLPKELLLGAVIGEDDETEICNGETILEAGNHLVVFTRPGILSEARRLFTK